MAREGFFFSAFHTTRTFLFIGDSMNKDIRIATSFKGHRKRKRLTRILGSGATDYLIDLWITVAQNNPEGLLLKWDIIDIADSAGWQGEPQEFVDALIKCNFLKKNGNSCFEIHDWCDHQGYACKARERSEQAKKAAEIRWKKNKQ